MQQCSEHHTLHKIWIKRSDFRDVVFSAVKADQIPILILRVRAVPQRNMPAFRFLPPRCPLTRPCFSSVVFGSLFQCP